MTTGAPVSAPHGTPDRPGAGALARGWTGVAGPVVLGGVLLVAAALAPAALAVRHRPTPLSLDRRLSREGA